MRVNMKKSAYQRWIFISKITSFSLFVVSTLFSVDLLTQFGDTSYTKTLFAAVAVCFQLGCGLCLILGYVGLSQKRTILATTLFVAYAGLLLLSLCASLGAFLNSSNIVSKKEGFSDSRYRLLTSELKNLDKSILDSEERIEGYASKRYFTHGVKPERASLEKLRIRRETVAGQIQNYDPGQMSESGNVFRELAAYLGTGSIDETQAVRMKLFSMISISLDALAGLLLVVPMLLLGHERDDSESGIEFQPRPNRIVHNSSARNSALSDDPGFYRNPGSPQEFVAEGGGIEGQVPAGVPAGMTRDQVEALFQQLITAQKQGGQAITTNQSVSENNQPKAGFTGKPQTQAQQVTPEVREVIPTYQVGDYLNDREFMKGFIHALFPDPTRKDKSLTGQQRICDELNISSEVCRGLRAELKNNGLIHVQGTKTMPDVSKEEMLIRYA